MVKVGILEFLYHHIFLYSLASVARKSGAEVTIFTTENLYHLVAPLFGNESEDYRWFIRFSQEGLRAFLKRVEKIASTELDLLFVNTLQGGAPDWLTYWTFAPKCKTVLVTGRITDWFGDSYRLAPQRDIKGLLHHNTQRFVTRRTLPRYDGIVVHTETMKDYALRHRYDKDVFVLPFSVFEGSPPGNGNSGKVKFVVTGKISDYRRDYDELLDAFEKLWSSGRSEISLTLLGWPQGSYGERIIGRCRLLKQRGFNIRFFEHYIPEEIFMDEIADADVLINPIKPDTYIHGMFMSGLVEAIRHAKPGIYPLGYTVPEAFLSSSLFYNRIEELPELIANNFLDNPRFLKELSRQAVANSEAYSLERISDYFKDTVLERMSTESAGTQSNR